MGPAVTLGAAAACFGGAALFHRHRGGVLAVMSRVRGFGRVPPGPRRRYQRGRVGAIDMLFPIVATMILGLVLLIRGLLDLR